MRVYMCIWVERPKNLPEWFKYGEEADVSWEQITELYDSGANVMLLHRDDVTFLAVDNRSFTQR
jgi:hypothetical protein